MGELLLRCAEWHALAKLRLHTEETLGLLDSKTEQLATSFATFQSVTCEAYDTRETSKEKRSRVKRSTKTSQKASAQTPTNTARAPAKRRRSTAESMPVAKPSSCNEMHQSTATTHARPPQPSSATHDPLPLPQVHHVGPTQPCPLPPAGQIPQTTMQYPLSSFATQHHLSPGIQHPLYHAVGPPSSQPPQYQMAYEIAPPHPPVDPFRQATRYPPAPSPVFYNPIAAYPISTSTYHHFPLQPHYSTIPPSNSHPYLSQPLSMGPHFPVHPIQHLPLYHYSASPSLGAPSSSSSHKAAQQSQVLAVAPCSSRYGVAESQFSRPWQSPSNPLPSSSQDSHSHSTLAINPPPAGNQSLHLPELSPSTNLRRLNEPQLSSAALPSQGPSTVSCAQGSYLPFGISISTSPLSQAYPSSPAPLKESSTVEPEDPPQAIPVQTSRLKKRFNLSTYKYHALADYSKTIRLYGTTDSYSSERVCFSLFTPYLPTASLTLMKGEAEHKLPKSWYLRTDKKTYQKQLANIERRRACIQKIRQRVHPLKPLAKRRHTEIPATAPYVVAASEILSKSETVPSLAAMESNGYDPALKVSRAHTP